MAIDSFSLYCMVPYLRDRFEGRRVRDVGQESPHEAVIRFQRRGDEESGPCILISSHTTHARVHTTARFPKSKTRTHFADVLFHHLGRCELKAVEQVGLDRILTLTFGPPPGWMGEDRGERRLVAEMMGKHSNLILVNESTGRIVDAAKHVDESRNRHREILPGVTYVAPPEDERPNPFDVTRNDLAALLSGASEDPRWRQLMSGIGGSSPAFTRALLHATPDPSDIDSVWATYSHRIAAIADGNVRPTVTYASDEPSAKALGQGLFPSEPLDPDARVVAYDTVNDAIAAYHDRLLVSEALSQQRQRLAQALTKREQAILRKRAALKGDLSLAAEADTYRLQGDLIMAALHEIEPRAESLTTLNYYEQDAPEVEIPLDPMKTGVENAQVYFKRYKRAKRGYSRIAELIADTDQELEWLAEYRGKLTGAQGLKALERLREQLLQLGWIKEKSAKGKQEESTPYRSFTSGPWRILLGRNDRENEWLVTRMAKKDDVWLHVKQIPGSHVLIRNPERKEQVPMPVLLAAAKLAAHFSKARNSSHVPVDYTWRRYVVRPKGTPSGFVTYSREKTLYVEPDSPSNLFGSGSRS